MNHRSAESVRRAFTLIEILIAVLILALGILGLGTVFPAIIREQRIGAEATTGSVVAGCAKTFLTTMDYEQALPVLTPLPLTPRDFWRNWRDLPFNGTLAGTAYQDGEWQIPRVDQTSPNSVVLGIYGRWAYAFVLPITERLYPSGTSAPPQFVWDVAVHRIGDGDPATDSRVDPLQIAIFVRRIDNRIRPAAGMTLLESFVATGANKRHPVGASPTTGFPTQDGTGDYAVPFWVNVVFDPAFRDRIYFTGVSPSKYAMIRQINQKLVDNLGNVYTVIASGTDGGNHVRVDPPVPATITAANAGALHQIVLTPQIPAAVLLFKAVDP